MAVVTKCIRKQIIKKYLFNRLIPCESLLALAPRSLISTISFLITSFHNQHFYIGHVVTGLL